MSNFQYYQGLVRGVSSTITLPGLVSFIYGAYGIYQYERVKNTPEDTGDPWGTGKGVPALFTLCGLGLICIGGVVELGGRLAVSRCVK